MINLNLNFRGLCDFSFAPLREPFDWISRKDRQENSQRPQRELV